MFIALLSLLPATLLSQSTCFSEGLVMYDQDVASNFAIDYPACTIIEGNVILGAAVNFVGMEQIIEIQGVIKCGGDGECGGQLHENFIGLENVISIGGINLEEHQFSFDGLESLELISGNVRLEECAFPNFQSWASLTEIEGDFDCVECNFENFFGLQNLSTVGGFFNVNENAILTNGQFISALTSVGGYFRIDECDVLDAFIAFWNLTEVGGDFTISDCPLVASLEGFGSLQSINGVLKLNDNSMLIDITDIANINPDGISFLELTDNPLLSECAVMSVCSHLLADGENTINLNSTDCNTAQEVIDQCLEATGVETNSQVRFTILKNLVADNLKVSNPENLEFFITDRVGRVLLRSNSTGMIPIDNLSSGVYFIVLSTGEASFKFVKQN